MRTELWGLRDKTTHEPIYTYWASSNKYRALFAKRETAEDACRNPRNPNMEPFCITGDPIKTAGGCYCGECCFGRKPHAEDMQDGYVYCQERSKYMSADDFCSDGELMGGEDNG